MTIGIVVAMESEIQSFGFEECNILSNDPLIYYKFVNHHHVYVYVCHEGKVNAAIGTCRLIEKFKHLFKFDMIGNVGVVGAVNPKYKLYDIVKPGSIQQHDVDFSALDYSKGDYINPDGSVSNSIPVFIHENGAVLGSGDVFVESEDFKQELRDREVDIVDMEGFSIAQVCRQYNVPFLCIKCVSDTVNSTEYTLCDLKLASKKLYDSFIEFLEEIPV